MNSYVQRGMFVVVSFHDELFIAMTNCRIWLRNFRFEAARKLMNMFCTFADDTAARWGVLRIIDNEAHHFRRKILASGGPQGQSNAGVPFAYSLQHAALTHSPGIYAGDCHLLKVVAGTRKEEFVHI